MPLASRNPSHRSMDHNDFSTIEDEGQAKYCGTASIKMSSLDFLSSAPDSFDVKRQDSLKRMLIEEKCQIEGGRHRATAVICQDDLDFALKQADIPSASLVAGIIPYPQLELPNATTLVCLKGCDVLAAAEKMFEGSDKRWVVDLFLDGSLVLRN